MPKYVCAFEEVTKWGEKVCSTANDLQTSVSTYSTNVESDLSGWTGDADGAKDAFIKAKNNQADSAKADCTYINEVGEFIKNSSNSILDLENELAGLSI